MEDDRVATLEETVAKMRAQDVETQNSIIETRNALAENQNTLNTIAAFMARLAQANTAPSEPFPTFSQNIVTPPAETHRTRTARPANPPDFDGDRAKGTAFLDSCQTYIR